MGKTINQLIEDIQRANQEQYAQAEFLSSKNEDTLPANKVARRRYNTLWSGLSKSFNTRAGSPRFSIVKYNLPEKWIPPKDKETPRTYGWNPITTMESGITVPYLYGTVKTKGNIINGYIDKAPAGYPDPNAQILSCLVAVGKGPIDSFVSGTINGEALFSTTTHVASFNGVSTFESRLGWTTQPVTSGKNNFFSNIPDFPEEEISYSSVYTATVDMTGYDDAWINLKFPNGLYRQQTGEDLAQESCLVAVHFRAVDGYWTTCFYGNISSNKKTIIRQAVRLYTTKKGNTYDQLLNSSYEIKVTKYSTDKNISEHKAENTLYVESIKVGIRSDFAYNGIAYTELSYLALKNINGSLDLSFVVKGRMVKIYSDVSTAEYEWTDNPAWVCFDILTQPIFTNTYYWNGDNYAGSAFVLDRYDGINPSQIDIQSFIDWAAHCDGAVTPPDYDLTDIKRCTFNGAFDSSTNLWDAAQSVAENNRAWLYPPSGTSKYRVALDKATAVTQVFTTANIIKDSLKETYTSIVDRASELQVDFINKDKEYETDTLNVVYSQALTVKEDSLQTFGITVPSQAWRRAMLELYYNAYVTVECEFDAGQDAINCEAGDVIAVQHELPQWGYGGRIVSANETTVVLDRPVNISDIATNTYYLLVRSSADVLTTHTIAFFSNPATGATYTLYGYLSNVPNLYDPFAFGKINLNYKPFRVTNVKNNGDQTFHISGQEYNASIYNVDTDTPPIPTPNYSSLNSLPSVTIDKLDEILIKNQDGSIIDCIDVYFTRPDNSIYAKANIYYREEVTGDYKAPYRYSGTTDTDKYRILDVLVNKTYEVIVATVNTVGRCQSLDKAPSATIYTIGKADPPSNVTNFNASQTGTTVVFTWTHIEDADLWGYEIRVGADWATSLPVIDVVSANRYDYPAPLDGTYRYWIVAIDTSGNKSTTPTAVDITIDGVEDQLNFLINEDVVTTYDDSGQIVYNYTWASGDLEFNWNVTAGSGAGTPPGYWADFTTNSDFIAVYESDDVLVSANPVKTTLRFSQGMEATIENATDQTFPTRLDSTYPTDTDQHISTIARSYLYFAFGDTTPATGNFTEYVAPYQDTLKYVRARSIIIADNYDTIVNLNSLRITADMQDIEFDIDNFEITHATGNVIAYSTYGHTMLTETPSIQASITYGTAVASPVSLVPYISRVNSSFFQIELKDIAGVSRLVSGAKVNIHVHGY